MDLMVVGHVVLRKHTLDLVKVPVWDGRHVFNVLRRAPCMPVLTVRPRDAKAKPVVVTLAIHQTCFVLGASRIGPLLTVLTAVRCLIQVVIAVLLALPHKRALP